MARRLVAALAAALGVASPSHAQDGPEQLEQIEPDSGRWQLEYYGAFGGGGAQSAQVLRGVGGWALGVEAEFEGPRDGLRLDSVAAIALYRLSDPETAPLGIGMEFQGAIDGAGRFGGAEARLILERRTPRWWIQLDAIGRHCRDRDARGTGLAYAVSLSRALREGIWLGVEASGQPTRLSGDAELVPQGRHFAGPSLTIEREVGTGGIELGLAWLQRIKGRGAGSGPRIFVQITL